MAKSKFYLKAERALKLRLLRWAICFINDLNQFVHSDWHRLVPGLCLWMSRLADPWTVQPLNDLWVWERGVSLSCEDIKTLVSLVLHKNNSIMCFVSGLAKLLSAEVLLHHLLLNWRRADAAEKTNTGCTQICDLTHRDAYLGSESVLNLIWILSGYETLEITRVNGSLAT